MGLLNYCSELSSMLPKKWHNQVHFVGGVLLGRKSDIDLFLYGKNAINIYACLEGKCFTDGREIDALTSLSTDDYFSNKESLTEYILSNGFMINVSPYDFKKLSLKGLFLSKLASYDNREEEKDLIDLKDIKKKLGKLPKNLARIIDDFDLDYAYYEIFGK